MYKTLMHYVAGAAAEQGGVRVDHKDLGIHLSLPEVPQEELISCVDYDDFLRRYGNPVIVKSEGHGDLVCLAREYYERLVLDLEYFRGQDPADYWIYEFSATEDKKMEFEKAAALQGMTMDDYLICIVETALKQARFDPERPQEELIKKAERESGIQLVRYYPVYKGETEEQAYKRKLAEEVAISNLQVGTEQEGGEEKVPDRG